MFYQKIQLSDDRTLVIREADGGDALRVLEYLEVVSGETAFLSFGSGEFEFSQKQESEHLEVTREKENGVYLLGMIEDELVGAISFMGGSRPRTRHTGEFGLTVRQSHWGLGIGNALLDALIHWARESGVVKKINLRVRTDNQRAIALYKRKGFKSEGIVRKEMWIEGVFYDNMLMGLDLGESTDPA